MTTDLQIVKELVYDQCGFILSNLLVHEEGTEYAASSFLLNKQTIEHRVSKITPTKTGQFVAIWKRNKAGETAPFDNSDNIDLLIITSRSGGNLGQFIFPKSALIEKGIFSQNGEGGKRGLRVYPPWDSAVNKQAVKTQNWQMHYFLEIKSDNSTDLRLAKKLLDIKKANQL